MKKIGTLLAVLMIVVASCKSKQGGEFVVSGKIENANSTKVYLEEIPFDGKQPVVVDSGSITNGQFQLKAVAREEGIYALSTSLNRGASIFLINDSKQIKVNLNYDKFKDYTTEGSPASTALHQYFDNYYTQYTATGKIYAKLDTLKQQNASDSLITVSNLQFQRELEKLKEMVSSFVNTSASPAASLHALSMGYGQGVLNTAETKQLALNAAKKFKDYSPLNRFQEIIAQREKSEAPKPYALSNQEAPEIALPTLKGDTVKLSSYRGKYVLVDFWASWCGPCRNENPNVVAAYKKFKDKNFAILGVSLDDNKKAWEKAIQEDSLTWTHVSDLKRWESSLTSIYHIEGIPFNVLVDPSGKIIAHSLRGEALEKKLAEVLK
jgi:peroxiredoxin